MLISRISTIQQGIGRGASLCLAMLVAFAVSPLRAQGQQPDPLALLRGVEQARSAIRSGTFEMSITKRHWLPMDQKDDLLLTILFHFSSSFLHLYTSSSPSPSSFSSC